MYRHIHMPSKEVFTLCTVLYCYQKTRLLNMVEKGENNRVWHVSFFFPYMPLNNFAVRRSVKGNFKMRQLSFFYFYCLKAPSFNTMAQQTFKAISDIYITNSPTFSTSIILYQQITHIHHHTSLHNPMFSTV